MKCFKSFVFLIALGASTSQAESKFETLPTLHAKNVLPRNLLSSPVHSVVDAVENDGYMNDYFLRSKYGDITVRSTYFLIKRITEIQTLKFINDNFPSTKVVATAAKETAKEIVVGPIKTTAKVVETLTDQEKLKKTAKAIPGGVANLFDVAAGAVEDLATFAYDTGKGAAHGSADDTEQQFKKAADFISDTALDYIGYSKAYRQMARVLQVDPYTDNELLRSELKRIAGIKSAVHIGSKFVPGYSIPGVGLVKRYLGYAERTATYDDPKEVEELNQKILTRLGKGEKSDAVEEDGEAFLKNKFFNPVMRNAILIAAEKLGQEGVGEIGYLLKAASAANSRETAQFYEMAIEKLTTVGEAHAKLKTIVRDAVLVAAVTKDGTVVIPLPVDYLVWTKEVSAVFQKMKSIAFSKYGGKNLEVLLSGRLTERCKQELQSLGASKIVKQVDFSPPKEPEPVKKEKESGFFDDDEEVLNIPTPTPVPTNGPISKRRGKPSRRN